MDGLVGGRFVVEREAGAGAMARVYRARDVTTNEPVALKILNSVGDHSMRRFEREVNALVDVNHPGIVKYIAHGTAPTGQAFLAMEWISGETLEARLERGSLDVEQALALGRAVAAALGAAHARGLVHRDVKPANLFLVDNEPARPKVLDFGLARDTMATFGLTNTGDLLGTPLFMSPEQASCELDIDARCDVYALGAVLYNCLAGRPPLRAPNLPGLLAKIVLEEPAVLTNVPRSIALLVARLLAKKREDRPVDGAAAEAAIAVAAAGLSQNENVPSILPSREQRVVSILLATNASQEKATLDATLGSHGGMLGLADGSTMVVFSGPETPGDLAARAARCALGLRAPSGVVALATGKAMLAGETPMGEVIDRASDLLAAPAGTVRVDAETIGLIEGRFELTRDAHGAILVGERAGELDAVRTLLGKPTRCIGRDRELSAIEGYFAECVADSVARAVIVIAEAGVGKSRLAHEVQRRLAAHSDAPQVVFVRCESITERSPFAAAAAAVRKAPGGPAAAARDEFLAELAGTPFPTASERMRAARENPALMFDHLRAAWVGWLRDTCARAPTLLVIEDLHWADEHSVLLVDAALQSLADHRFMVLALARPEIRARRPWAARRPHELPLDPLTKRASERLVRDALGPLATDDVVAGILSRAEGHALFLEELVRAAADPKVTALPVGVIGTLQLRFDSLRSESRTVLRVASVYGERFTQPGVEALVSAGLDVKGALAELAGAEVIAASADGFAFRHALVREAAYAMLPDADRAIAHTLAAEALERESEHDPAVIALHFELGGRGEQAARWYAKAAEYALVHNDLASALAHARRAQQWATEASEAGALQLLVADAEMWLGNIDDAKDAALRATALLPTGETPWLHAAGLVITSSGQLGENETVADWLARLNAIEPTRDAVPAYALCLARASSQLAWGDDANLAVDAFVRAKQLSDGHELGPMARGRIEFAHAFVAYIDGRVDLCCKKLREVAELYDAVGARRDAVQSRLISYTMGVFGGVLEDTIACLMRCLVEAEAIEAPYIRDWSRYEIALALLAHGDRERASAELAAVPERIKSTPLFRGGHTIMALWAAFLAEDVAEMEVLLEGARTFRTVARYRAANRAFGAYVLAMRGDNEQARDEAHAAIRDLQGAPGMKADVQLIGFAAAFKTLWQVGAEDRSALDAHLGWLETVASRFTDPDAKRAFLEITPWNAYVRQLSGRHNESEPVGIPSNNTVER